MKLLISTLGLAAMLVAPVAALAQEDAGRVLVTAGEVVIVRGATRIPVQTGVAVRAGDTMEVGPQSSAQVRFTDESVVALRPDTAFRVTEYVYQGTESGAQRAVFDLLRGGIRTVTGFIGRRNHADYAVKTRTVSIGIRGTSYKLVDCANSCRNADGSLAPDGTYGAVTEGHIAATNEAGEREFGTDNYFYVANPITPPQQLLAPPSFLVAIRGRATRTQLAQAAKSTAATAAAAASSAEATGTSELSGSMAASATPVAYQVTNTPTLETFLSPDIYTGTRFYRLTGPFSIPFTCSSPPCTATAGEITLGVNYALQRATLGYALKFDDGTILNVSVPISISGVPVTITGNQVSFSGTFNLADFPYNRGSFRCLDCANSGNPPGYVDPIPFNRGSGGANVGNGPAFVDQLTFSGNIAGSQASVTLSATSGTGTTAETGTGTATLTLTAPPNNAAAAIVTQRQDGGADARSAAFWNAQLDAAGRLLQFGPNVGQVVASVGTATNTIAGSAPAAGNLVWGTWSGGGSTITDYNYATFTTSSSQRQPWISGDANSSLPPSLGTLSFTPVGSVFSSTSGQLNRANLTADFVNRSLSLSLNATNTAAQNTFQMDASTGFSPTTGRFSAGFNSVTCSGPCVGGTPSGNFAGFFAGTQAQGAGVAFTGGFGVGTGVSGVIAFGR